jgi:hypothetical protein
MIDPIMNCLFCNSKLLIEDNNFWQYCTNCKFNTSFTFTGWSHSEVIDGIAAPSSYSFIVPYNNEFFELWFYPELSSFQLGRVSDTQGNDFELLLKLKNPPKINPDNVEAYLIQLLSLKSFY